MSDSRLAAVLFADVVGYSDLSARDEARALKLIHVFHEASRSTVPRFGGRVVKFMGDGMMAEFPSSRAAIGAAAWLMEACDRCAAERDLDPASLRIGIHVGDVSVSGEDIFGGGVNIAARLEAMAEPGEILVSGDVYRQLRQRKEIDFEPRGERELKGVGSFETFAATLTEPIEPSEALETGPAEVGLFGYRSAGRALMGLAIAAIIALTWYVLGGGERGRVPGASIAVLPFETMGDANPIFTSGIHGDILTRLSGVSGLDVISRSAVMGYRDLEKPASEVARELGVNWVLEGEVRQVGDQVQVNARLVDARSNRQVWAETFQRELSGENLFDIQREITLQIAAALETQLTPRELRAMEYRSTDDLEAYEAYVKGRDLLDARTEESMRRAITHFQNAIERDPDYAVAWAGLAGALALLKSHLHPAPEGTIEPERAAARALELEPGLAEAHAALGLLAHLERKNAAAIEELEQAVERRPSYAEAHDWLSWVNVVSGRPEAALEGALRLAELDPLGAAAAEDLAFAHLVNGDARKALEEARRIRDRAPDNPTGPFYEALALYHLGRFSEAGSILEGLSVLWAGAGPQATLGLTQVALGDTAGAWETLAGIDASEHAFSLALVRSALGETDLAVEDLDGIEDWDHWSTLALRYLFPEVLGPLRSDPGYQTLLRRVDRSWGLEPMTSRREAASPRHRGVGGAGLESASSLHSRQALTR